MSIQLWRGKSAFTISLTLLILLLLAWPSSSWAAEKPRLRVDDYKIEAELTPHTHQVSARVKVVSSSSLEPVQMSGSPLVSR